MNKKKLLLLIWKVSPYLEENNDISEKLNLKKGRYSIMNKTFKKIVASVMAVTSLVASMTSFSASAVEPRYGGSDSFTINGARVTTSIDAYKTVAGASTTNSSDKDVTYIFVSITGYNSDGSTVYDSESSTVKDKVSVSIDPSIGATFTKGSSYHSATYNGATGSKSMSVNVPI